MSGLRGRPFAPGNTFGRGRPKGSSNKTNSQGDDLLGQYADSVKRKCVAMALQGNPQALRMCMERISPRRLDARIQLSWPKIRSAHDVEKAAEKITQAIQRGKISPLEGSKMMSILETRSRFMENANFESRLEKLEENLARSKNLPR